MISKELLSTVIGIEVINFSLGGYFIEYSAVGILRDINIFELAHKCKELLIKKGYFFDISHSTMGLDCRVIVYGKGIKEYFIADTEEEAIFKACEWVIKQ